MRVARDAGPAKTKPAQSKAPADAGKALPKDASMAPPLAPREPEMTSATIDGTCDKAGCIRSFKELGDYAKSDIESYLEQGVTIDNGYSV